MSSYQQSLADEGIDDLMIPNDGEPDLNCACPPENEPVCSKDDGSFAARNLPCAVCAGFQADSLTLCSKNQVEEGPYQQPKEEDADQGEYQQEGDDDEEEHDDEEGSSADIYT
eukprot:scaffold402850_cov43-Prasinocladus_malaysianus.AAC.1